MIMPPSPALRSSPGRESRGSNHKRGHSFESAVRIREKDDDLALFNEMQTREREGFLLQSAEDLEDSFSTKLRHFSDLKLGISIPVRGENSDLLNNVEAEKNDYDWLLTPPDTPLFPSLDDEPPSVAIASRGRPRSQPISISRSSTMEKSHRSSTSRGSPSPNRLSPSPRSANSVPQLRGRQLSAPHSSPTPSLRHATPSRRSTTPTRRSPPPPSTPSTSVPRSSTPTPRRLSTGSSGTAGISGARGTSPIKSVRGNSASPKIRAWQTNIPGFSSDPPPNLRTSLDDRPASYVRGSSPASRNSRDLAHKYGRQSMSPTASRSISSSHSHDRDRYSSYSRGSIASSGDDDLDSLQSIPISSLDNSLSKGGISFSNNKALAFSKKHRIVSSSAPKRSLDSTIRHLDRKSPNMFRPLLSSVPSTTFYTGKASSAHRSLISRNSSVTTSSNASSDHGTCIALDTEGSDQNQDDMVNECEKIQYHNSHEEIFAFDKMDIVDEDPIHDIKSLDSGPALGCDPVVTGDSSYEAVVPDISSTSDSSHVQGADFSEIVCLEDTVVCSRCGCRYRVTDTEENDANLCPECSREEKCLSLAISENMTAVTESLSGLSSVKYEDKPFDKVELVVISPDSALANDLGESRISMFVGNVEQDQASYPEQGPSYVENFPAETPSEESQHSLINHLEIGQSAVSGNQPDTGSGYQQPLQRNDYQSLRFDSPEGAGISILLKRSSSSKGPVVQGRTFTASTISYDDLSFARDSMSSLRSSIGHSSFSASSSADFSSARQIEARMQRQLSLSSRKGELENKKGEISVKSHCAEIASSGIPASAHPISGFETCKQDENVDFYVANLECSSCQGTTTSSQKAELASENGKSDDTSSISVAVVEEDKFEYDTCRILDTCTSELSREDSSGGRSVSDKDASVTNSDCSKLEGHNMLGDVFEDERSEVSTHPMITISETEATQIAEVVASGSQDDISTISMIPLEEESVLRAKCDYEDLRNARILENKERLASLGLKKAVTELRSIISSAKSARIHARKCHNTLSRISLPLRRSDRLKQISPVSTPVRCQISFRRSDRLKRKLVLDCNEVEGEVVNRPANAPLVKISNSEHWTSPDASARRCNSKGRGGVYDPVFGICCHFCRQKKLCGEEDCRRCGDFDMDEPCIGKTDCSVCHSTNGVFCRACLKVRYGEEMEEVIKNKKWMCPHCVEEKGINSYWICNSSLCLKKRKMAPTGLAIYRARKMGYESVAHLLMDELKRADLRNR